MDEVRISYRICNPEKPELCQEVKDALVDTGSTYNLVPASLLEAIQVKPWPQKVKAETATGEVVEQEIASVLCEVDGVIRPCIVHPGGEGVEPILGVESMQMMGMKVEPRTGRISFEKVRLNARDLFEWLLRNGW